MISYLKVFVTTSVGNENNAGVNILTQKSVNSKSPTPNSGRNLLSTCVAWIQSTKYDLRHLQSPSSTGDETNVSNASLSHLANTINQTFLAPINAFQPLTSDHSQALILSDTSNQLPSIITTTKSYILKKLSSIVHTKAHVPDTIPVWLLKENADLLANPV